MPLKFLHHKILPQSFAIKFHFKASKYAAGIKFSFCSLGRKITLCVPAELCASYKILGKFTGKISRL